MASPSGSGPCYTALGSPLSLALMEVRNLAPELEKVLTTRQCKSRASGRSSGCRNPLPTHSLAPRAWTLHHLIDEYPVGSTFRLLV